MFLPRHVQPTAGTPGNSSCPVKAGRTLGACLLLDSRGVGRYELTGAFPRAPLPPR